MLDNKVTLQHDSIEKLFCEPFSKLPVKPMTEEQTGIMVSVMTAENQGKKTGLIDAEDPKVPFSIKMMQKSLGRRFHFGMTEPLQLMMASICPSVGIIVMYLTYLQYQSKKLNKYELTVNDLADIFPMGFPTDESLKTLWDAQKVKRSDHNLNGSDNLLDYQTALQSIILKKEENSNEEE